MQKCKKCGKEISDNSKFCNYCGEPLEQQNSDSSKTREEYAGKVIKCPSCGEQLKAFETVCPVCGYELRDVRTTKSIHEFTDKLENEDDEKKQ